MNGKRLTNSRNTLLALAITVLLVVPVFLALTSGIALAASVDPVVVDGNPTCADLNADDVNFPSITSDFEFKIDSISGAFDGVYQRIVSVNQNGFPTELLGGAPVDAGEAITISNSDSNSFDFASTYAISAVVVKAANEGNVYVYDPASFGDTDLETATGQSISNVKFCFGPDQEPAPVTIRARKYNDLNMNGERDGGEPYLEGWTMKVFDDQDQLVGSKTTDVDGWAVWNDVPAGNYTVCEELQDNWINTQAGALKPGNAVNGYVCSQEQLLEPGADWSFLFGNYEEPEPELVKLRVFKYHDLNQDGSHKNFGDDKEPGLQGWTMNVYDANNQLVDSQQTGTNGYYTWDVPVGEYTVCEELQQHWVNTEPGTPPQGDEVCYPAQVLDTPDFTYLFKFGNFELAPLRVFKYNDLNMDGSHKNFGDDKEPGLEDWVFNVYDDEGFFVDSKMTGPNGYYTWWVPPGEYTVCELLQEGWVNTQAGTAKPGVPGGPDEVCAPLQAFLPVEQIEAVQFGNYLPEPEPARLRVFKYNDLNMNGKKDAGEPGLEDWVFNVYANGGLVDSQMTGPNGYYTWDVPAGEYTVCEELQPGWINTEPGTPPQGGEVCYPAEVLEPGQLRVFEFGNYFEEPPPGFCPPDELAFELTDVLGVGQGSPKKAYRSRTLYIPDYEEVAWLYGQLAAVDVGQMKYVRFRYPDKSYVQINNPTSPAYHTYMINWWGDYLEPAKFIKGQFFWKKSARLSPRAFVLWPTYMTDEPYANTFRVFDVSKENHVFWKTTDAAYEWFPQQTQKLTLPPTQAQGADIVVKIALVDVNMDQRPVILTVSAGGVSESRVIFVSNKKELLNLETFVLKGVDEGTSEVVIHLLSPAPSAQYPDGGDSVAMIGAAAHYACVTNGIVTPDLD